ncbi:efflux RND transporter periplasmic adaptor subunit [Thiomicrorhabdus indica]|uniref:efflux RND transporter periplasmic adaptor subunit n=1 Tax=Thiomicrorhabdus indica TaxID=2267253 RepID=UPI00102E0324|nr:efflux RND transporter periplasmic adaptor subunit [Thiomicrorhabdus indica]
MKMLRQAWQTPFIVVYCLVSFHSANAQNIQFTEEQQQATSIQTATVERPNTFPSQWFLGHLDVLNQAEQTISSPLTGKISKIYKHSGHVMPNEPLIDMISPKVAGLQSELLTTIAKLTAAYKDLTRLQGLSRSGSASTKDYQTTKAEVASLQATQSEMEQSLLNYGFANSALQQLKQTGKLQASLVTIKSAVEAEIHDVTVIPGQNMDEYQPLMTLINHENLMVKVPVPINQTAGLKIGDMATVKIGNQTLNALVFFIPHHLDVLTQTQEVQLQFSDNIENLNLNLNQRVKVQFEQTTSKTLYRAPLKSLTQADGQDIVFAEVKPGKYEMIDINVVTIEQNSMYFQTLKTEPLKKVVSQGTTALKLALGAEEE